MCLVYRMKDDVGSTTTAPAAVVAVPGPIVKSETTTKLKMPGSWYYEEGMFRSDDSSSPTSEADGNYYFTFLIIYNVFTVQWRISELYLAQLLCAARNISENVEVPSSEHVAEIVGRQGLCFCYYSSSVCFWNALYYKSTFVCPFVGFKRCLSSSRWWFFPVRLVFCSHVKLVHGTGQSKLFDRPANILSSFPPKVMRLMNIIHGCAACSLTCCLAKEETQAGYEVANWNI